MENPIKMDIWGYHYFLETSMHIYIYISVLAIHSNPQCDDVTGILSAVSHIPRVLPPPVMNASLILGLLSLTNTIGWGLAKPTFTYTIGMT